VIARAGPGAAPRNAQPDAELRERLARHGRAAGGVEGEPGGFDAVLEDGLMDGVAAERAGLASRNPPRHNAAAVYVDRHVQVVVAANEGQEPGDATSPDLVCAGSNNYGFLVAWVR
jgi:hypothetical protein